MRLTAVTVTVAVTASVSISIPVAAGAVPAATLPLFPGTLHLLLRGVKDVVQGTVQVHVGASPNLEEPSFVDLRTTHLAFR